MTHQVPAILVVEDEVVVARDIAAQLKECAFNPVGFATRGEQAIALSHALKPDLVLMDIKLPGAMDGIEAADAIYRQLGIPVVFLTAFSAPGVLARAKEVQPFGFLHKPFTQRELATCIEMALCRSEADARLRASEMRFRAIFEAEPECVMVVSAKAEILQINAAGLQVLGAPSLEALASKSLPDYISAQDCAAFMDLHGRVISGNSGALTFAIQSASGELHQLETRAVPMQDAKGEANLMLALSRDTTHRKIAAHERRLGDHIFSAVSQGILVTQRDQTIVSVNRSFMDITGFNREDLIGHTCQMLQGPLTDADSRAQIREAISQGLEYQGEIVNYRKDGRWFWNDLSISPVRDESGVVTNFIGVTRDVTERKQAEIEQHLHFQQLQSMSKRILEVQESERRRIARELHDELGQSLTALKINLQTGTQLDQAQRQQVNAENIRIVESTIAQIRTLALALRPSMLDDLGLVPALRWMADQTASRGQIQIDLQCALPDARLSAEVETACFRIVQEALTNVLRHARCTRVDVMLYASEGLVTLSIRDDGCGFKANRHSDPSHPEDRMGIQGMQERAMLIGGTLEIESSQGNGSTVHMQCPVSLRATQ